MRFWDYRSNQSGGIALCLASPFTHKGVYELALGRVGRHEPCRRYQVGDSVSNDKEQLFLQRAKKLELKNENLAKLQKSKAKMAYKTVKNPYTAASINM